MCFASHRVVGALLRLIEQALCIAKLQEYTDPFSHLVHSLFLMHARVFDTTRMTRRKRHIDFFCRRSPWFHFSTSRDRCQKGGPKIQRHVQRPNLVGATSIVPFASHRLFVYSWKSNFTFGRMLWYDWIRSWQERGVHQRIIILIQLVSSWCVKLGVEVRKRGGRNATTRGTNGGTKPRSNTKSFYILALYKFF